MRERRRAETAASPGSRCGAEPAPSSASRASLRPRSVVLARPLHTQPSAAAESSPDRWRQAPPPPTPNHEQELPGERRTRVGAETQPGPEENGESRGVRGCGGAGRAGRGGGRDGAAGSDLSQPAAAGPGRPEPPRPLCRRDRLHCCCSARPPAARTGCAPGSEEPLGLRAAGPRSSPARGPGPPGAAGRECPEPPGRGSRRRRPAVPGAAAAAAAGSAHPPRPEQRRHRSGEERQLPVSAPSAASVRHGGLV